MKLLHLLKQQHQFAQKCLENVATSSNSIFQQPGTSQSNSPEAKGITILLMHTCEPCNNFYAKTYLNQLLQRHLLLPKLLSSPLAEFCFKFATLPKQCVKNSISYPFYPEAVVQFSSRLESSTSQLLPEFGPIRCLPASGHEEPRMERQLQKVFSDSFDHLILLPISPLLQPNRIATEISVIHKRIKTQTNPIQIDQDEELEPDGEPVPEYVPRNAPRNKFSLLVVDSLHSSECIVQYWASRLVPLLEKYEVIVFTSSYPLSSFTQCRIDLKECSRRIMYAAYKDSSKSTPWRICFYSGWEMPIGLANLMNRMSIQRDLGKLKSGRRKGPVLVVPLDSLFRNFNTETALPRAIGNLPDADGFVVNILQPEPDGNALVFSLAELIKIMMLNRRKFAR